MTRDEDEFVPGPDYEEDEPSAALTPDAVDLLYMDTAQILANQQQLAQQVAVLEQGLSVVLQLVAGLNTKTETMNALVAALVKIQMTKEKEYLAVSLSGFDPTNPS